MVSYEDWSPYIAAWQERRHQSYRAQQQRAATGRAAAQVCARILVERYGARRVWLFGSLTRPHTIHNESDIDLAVEGLPPNQYYPALATLWAVLADTDADPTFTLDLVPLEDARLSLVHLIRTEGKLLYEHA